MSLASQGASTFAWCPHYKAVGTDGQQVKADESVTASRCFFLAFLRPVSRFLSLNRIERHRDDYRGISDNNLGRLDQVAAEETDVLW
jgi:hypothetical protein